MAGSGLVDFMKQTSGRAATPAERRRLRGTMAQGRVMSQARDDVRGGPSRPGVNLEALRRKGTRDLLSKQRKARRRKKVLEKARAAGRATASEADKVL